MKTKLFVSISLACLILTGCATTSENRIEVDRNSEMASIMARMDAKGREFQNRNIFTKALREFEEGKGNPNPDVTFDSLEEPGKALSNRKREYIMIGIMPNGSEEKYLVHISFRDAALTVAKKVLVLKRIGLEVEPVGGADSTR